MIGWLFLSVVLVSKSSVSGTNLTNHSALQETTTARSLTTEAWTVDTTNPATGSVKSSTTLSDLSTLEPDVSTSFNVISITANDTLISRTVAIQTTSNVFTQEHVISTSRDETYTNKAPTLEAGSVQTEAGSVQTETGSVQTEAGSVQTTSETPEDGDYPEDLCHLDDNYEHVFCDSQHYCCGRVHDKKCCPKLPAGAIFGIVSSSIVICMFLVCCFVASCRWCDVCPYRKVRVARKMSISSAIYNRGERQTTELPAKDEKIACLQDYQQNASSDNVNEPAKPIEYVDDIDLKVSGAENQDPFTAITLSEDTVV